MAYDNETKSFKTRSEWLGWCFLGLIVLNVAESVLFTYLEKKGVHFPSVILIVISELSIAVPGIIYMILNKMDIQKDCGFRKVKPGTVFMSVLIGFLIIPVASFVNILSQFFVPNTMTQASDSLLGGSSVLLLFVGGLFGPLCEEYIFRGVYGNEYRKCTTGFKAMLMSGLLFGLMHLNWNQFCYAVVLGIIFYIVCFASGSVYTSFIVHATVNSVNLLMMVMYDWALKMSGSEANLAETTEAARTPRYLLVTAAVYFVLALICGAITVPCVKFLARHEGRMPELVSLFSIKEKETGEKVLLNIPTVLAIVVSFAIMCGYDFFMKLIGLN